MGGEIGENGYMCMYGWVPLLSPWICHNIVNWLSVQFSSVAQSCPTLRPHESQHARPPCPSPTPGVHSNSCSLSRWYHPTISSSVVPFSSCPQSLPASGSFPLSQLFASGGQNIGASTLASVLPKNIQGWFPLRLTGLISLPSKGFSRVFSRRQGWDDFREKHWNIYIIMWNRSPVQVRCMNQGAQGRYSGMTLRDGRGGGSGWGTHVYLWQIHFDIWQNQYNIVKLNKIKFKKIKK